MISPCSASDAERICEVINEAAKAYLGVIPGDCWHEPYMSLEEVRAEIEAGKIVDIAATHPDAKIFDNWMRSFNDPNVYYISHLGFGLDPRATVDSSDPAALESIDGSIVLGFGSNVSPTLGGDRHAKGHMDCVLMNATMTLDDRKILIDGKFSEDTGLAWSARQL